MAKRAPKTSTPSRTSKTAPKAGKKAAGKSPAKPAGKPVVRGTKAAAKAAAKPAGRPASKSAGKAGGKSGSRPAAKPAAAKAPVRASKAPANTAALASARSAPSFDPTLAAPAAERPAPAPLSERDAKLKRQQETSRQFAIEVARLCKDDKCTDVVLLDVRGLSSVTDYIIVGSGTSDRQMKSVLDHVAELGHKHGFAQSKTNSDDRSTWLLIDFVDVMVHLFEPSTRAHYDIEMLWGDAPRIEWERADQIDRDRAGLSASRR
jgi:ribosome-associated protein